MRSSVVAVNQTAFAQQHNALRADAAGAGSLLVHQQVGAFSIGSNPASGSALTLTVNGSPVTVTFVSAIGSAAGNVLIGASAAATCANLLALLLQPQVTSATQVAVSPASQALLSYLSYALVGTVLTVSSNNKGLYSPLTGFAASTTATGCSWTGQTMALFVEPGTTTIAGVQVNFPGGSTPAFSAPVAQPRVDLITITPAGSLAIVSGTEAASPAVPAYPIGVTTLAEVYHAVGETALFDNDNQQVGQGHVQRDSRPFFNITQIVTAGLMMMWPAATPPSGWLILDGSAISRATYAALFALFGTSFGSGDGSTTFNLPDMRGNVAVGYKSGDANFGTFGAATGEAAHTLTAAEMPSHSHSMGSIAGSGSPGELGGSLGVSAVSTGSAGGGGAHNNVQPSLVISYIIKT